VKVVNLYLLLKMAILSLPHEIFNTCYHAYYFANDKSTIVYG